MIPCCRQSGRDGNYLFEGLPAGDYVVDVTDENGAYLFAGLPLDDGDGDAVAVHHFGLVVAVEAQLVKSRR